MSNLFTNPPRLPLIAPSILSADFMRMGEDCRHVLSAGADLLHLDVMDGHFVPNLTMGPDMCRWLRSELPDAFLDVHLMVTEPGKFVEPFLAAGADHLTFHVEIGSAREARELSKKVRGGGATVGLALNPETSVEEVLPLVPDFDLILVMSVHPGFSGQDFIGEVLTKTSRLKSVLGTGQRLEMDGGIGLGTIGRVIAAGCDTMVAASAVFGVSRGERSRVIGALRGSK